MAILNLFCIPNFWFLFTVPHVGHIVPGIFIRLFNWFLATLQFVTRESTKALCQCCAARPSRTRVFSLSWMQSATTCHLLWTYHPPRQARGNRSIWIHLVRRFHPAKVKFHPAKLGNPRVYLRWWLQKTDSKRQRYARVTRHARAQGKNPKNDEEELIRETSPDEKLGFSCGRL